MVVIGIAVHLGADMVADMVAELAWAAFAAQVYRRTLRTFSCRFRICVYSRLSPSATMVQRSVSVWVEVEVRCWKMLASK
jgi:hypothetical protein